MTRPDFNDCFAASGARMPVAEALGLFSKKLSPVVEPEDVRTRDAAGRILAADIVSECRIPPHNNAAVDGFAVAFDDLDPDDATTLAIGGTIAAGHPLNGPAELGKAYRIFTGAQMPSGADTVFMIEDCGENDGAGVVLPAGIRRGDNMRLAGEDVEPGDVVMRTGSVLRPQEIGMAASLGRASLPVFKRLRVAVFSTGDEVRDPGSPLDDGAIYDINRYSLMSMLDALGCQTTDLGIFADDLDTIANGIAAAASSNDLVITSGGVSIGDEDHIRAAIARLGAINFWNLAIKPGRPIALGHVTTETGGVPFVGLPGNPVAAMVTFLCIARPILLRLAGAEDVQPQIYKVPAGFEFKKKPGRREWLRARLDREFDGTPVVERYPDSGSGILTSMVQSDGLVELDEACEFVRIGELVNFVPFSEVMR